MKLILITILLFSGSAFGANAMSETELSDYVTEAAKQIRKAYWRSGHEDVYSNANKVSKEFLDEWVKEENNKRYEDPLDSDEISQLYKCFYRKNCELYLVEVSGSYWGGSGSVAHFLLIDPEKRKHEEISHTTYAE